MSDEHDFDEPAIEYLMEICQQDLDNDDLRAIAKRILAYAKMPPEQALAEIEERMENAELDQQWEEAMEKND